MKEDDIKNNSNGVIGNESTTKTTIWWEKTVEYKFIADCLEKGIIKKIAPLDGFQESIGDTIAILENSIKDHFFYVIEFKLELNGKEFNGEYGKFEGKGNGYKVAQKCFNAKKNSPEKKSHYFIGAKFSDGNFELVVRDYFAVDRKKFISVEEALSDESGMTKDEFYNYVRRFVSHKKKNKCNNCSNQNEGGSASRDPDGGISPDGGGDAGIVTNKSKENYMTQVIAISPRTKECVFFPLEPLTIIDGMGGQPSAVFSPKIGGLGGGEVAINNEEMITHPIHIILDPRDLSRPNDREVEIEILS